MGCYSDTRSYTIMRFMIDKTAAFYSQPWGDSGRDLFIELFRCISAIE